MAVSKRLRYEIFRRDNHACRYCGASAPDVKLQVDHVVPDALGGDDDPSNLVTSCESCNAGKSSIHPDAEVVADVEQDAIRWSKAMERAAEVHRERSEQMEFVVRQFPTQWSSCFAGVWKVYGPNSGDGPWHYQGDEDDTYDYCVYAGHVDDELRPQRAFKTFNEAREWMIQEQKRKTPPVGDGWQSTVRNWLRAGVDPVDLGRLMREVAEERPYVAWDQKYRYFAGCVWNVIRQRQEIAHALLAAGEEDALEERSRGEVV